MHKYCIVYYTDDGCDIEATIEANTKWEAERILKKTTPDLEKIIESYKIW